MKKTVLLAAFCLGLSACGAVLATPPEQHEKAGDYAESVRAYEAKREAIVRARGINTTGSPHSNNRAFVQAGAATDDSPLKGEQ